MNDEPTLDLTLEFFPQDTEVVRPSFHDDDDDDLPTLQEGALPPTEELEITTRTRAAPRS